MSWRTRLRLIRAKLCSADASRRPTFPVVFADTSEAARWKSCRPESRGCAELLSWCMPAFTHKLQRQAASTARQVLQMGIPGFVVHPGMQWLIHHGGQMKNLPAGPSIFVDLTKCKTIALGSHVPWQQVLGCSACRVYHLEEAPAVPGRWPCGLG